MKKFLIHLLDKVDNNLLNHRWYWLCKKIADSSWWGEEECGCVYCAGARQ